MHSPSTTDATPIRNDTSKSVLLSYESDGIEVSLYRLPAPLDKVWLEISLNSLSVASARPTSLVRMDAGSDTDLFDFIMRSCLIAKQWRAEANGQPAQQWLDALVMHLASNGPPYAEEPTLPSRAAELH